MYRAIAGLIVLVLASVLIGTAVHGTVSADEVTQENTATKVGTWAIHQPGHGAVGCFTFISDQTVIYVDSTGMSMLGVWAQDGGLIVVTVEAANPDVTGRGFSFVVSVPSSTDDTAELGDGGPISRVSPDMSVATPTVAQADPAS